MLSMCLLHVNPGGRSGGVNGCRAGVIVTTRAPDQHDRDRSRGDDASVLGARVPGDAVPLDGHLLSARPPQATPAIMLETTFPTASASTPSTRR